MIFVILHVVAILSLAVVSLFRTDMINSTAVIASWTPVDSPYLDHYTVYYYLDPDQSDKEKRQSSQQTIVFPVGSSSGVIGGLKEGQDYLFSLAVTFNINGQLFEGRERTEPAPPG